MNSSSGAIHARDARRSGAIYGIALGLVFVLVAIATQWMPGEEDIPSRLLDEPLLWIIYSAPLVLGLLAAFAGGQYGRAQCAALELETRIAERTTALEDASLRQAVLYQVLELSLEAATEKQLLEQSLNTLLSLRSLSPTQQGAILLLKGNPKSFHLEVQKGREPGETDPIFPPGSNKSKGILFQELLQHSRYNVPISSGESVVGMLILTVPSGATRNGADVEYLRAFSEVLGAALQRLSLEVEIQSSNAAREHSLIALEAARRTAVKASQSKSAFLANMSHEIRTPMTAILGYADLLSEPDLDEFVRGEHVRTIKKNGSHLLAIINDILDVSKIEAGKMEVEKIDLSPWEIPEDACRLMREKAQEKGLHLDLQFDYPLPLVLKSDPVRLRQVLLNLLGNALKFTEKGKVELRVSYRSDANRAQLIFKVIDSGIGMNEEQISRLFTPFSQADTSTTRKFGGTGLGLTISRYLAELMGGELTLHSKPKKGSEFSLLVDGGPHREEFLTHERPPRLSIATKAGNSNDGPQNRGRILLVEDTKVNQRLAERFLTKAGHQVHTADDGKEALERALEAWGADEPYQVILMDMHMPVMDGYEATRKLREAGYLFPIVALTANAMTSDRELSMNSGCDDFATKPFDRPRLLQVVSDWVGKAEAMQSQQSTG